MMETESGRLRRRYVAGFEDGGVGPQPGSPEASRGWEGKETDGQLCRQFDLSPVKPFLHF